MSVDTYDSVQQPKAKHPAEAFEEMAKAIRHNEERADPMAFGGAVVIVPPGQLEALNILVLDPTITPGNFYAMVTDRIRAAIDEIDMRQRQGLDPFALRR